MLSNCRDAGEKNVYAVSMSPLIRAAHLAFTRSVTAARFSSGEDSFVTLPIPAHPAATLMASATAAIDARPRNASTAAPRSCSPKHCQIIWIALK